LDSFLLPLACLHDSYIKDTYDFISKIKNKLIPPNSLLVTYDVTSLYTNMNLNRTIAVVKQTFIKYPLENRPDNLIIQALDIILKNSDFDFNNETFIQTTGIAMGKRFAPSLANLYLIHLDNIITKGFPKQSNDPIIPLFTIRFLDDGLFCLARN